MHDLTGFQRDLLYTIAGQEEPHGLAIKEYSKTTTRRRSTTDGSTRILTNWSIKDWWKKANSTGGPTPTRSLSAAAVRSMPDVSGKTNTWLAKPESTADPRQRS